MMKMISKAFAKKLFGAKYERLPRTLFIDATLGCRNSIRNFIFGKRASLWRYFFRYLSCHKNYLLNTAVMWCVALVRTCFLREMAGLSVIPVGFAILSFNTPICILLSCDSDLEQTVRFLPGQKRRVCIPYCLFIFLCNMAAGTVFFAMQSAMLVLLAVEAVVFLFLC